MDICYGEYKGRTVSGFIKYVLAKIKEKHRDESYRIYVTDMLYNLVHSKDIVRWYDIAYGEVTEQDEAEIALKNFYSDFRGGDKD